MIEEEIYEFDLTGYIVYPDLITPDDVDRMNDIIDANLTDQMNPGHFGFFPGDGARSDTCFLELMAHPRTLQIIRVMLGGLAAARPCLCHPDDEGFRRPRESAWRFAGESG